MAGCTRAVNSVARVVGENLAAGSAAVSAASTKIVRLARIPRPALPGRAPGVSPDLAPGLAWPAGRPAAEMVSPSRSRADWSDLVRRIPPPRAAAA
jgi:hypothetical protein